MQLCKNTHYRYVGTHQVYIMNSFIHVHVPMQYLSNPLYIVFIQQIIPLQAIVKAQGRMHLLLDRYIVCLQ